MPQLIDILAAAARDRALVVTANQRLARDWQQRYDRHQAACGLRAWVSPRIVHWPAWVQSLWRDAVMAGAAAPLERLTRDHAEAVWRGIVERSAEGRDILQPRAAALSAMSAWNLIQQHLIPWKSLVYGGHDDWNAFAAWAFTFERQCHSKGWIDDARLATAVAAAARTSSQWLPPRLALGGFDEMTPQQAAVLESLAACGCPHEQVVWEAAANPAVARTEHLDPAAELRAAARWARDKLAADRRARIGVVIPELSTQRALAERIFSEVLHPDWIAGMRAGRPSFHISAGRPLDSWPVVHAAFRVFSLARPVLPLAEAGAIARSPYLGGNIAEAPARALDDAKRRRGRPSEVRTSEVDAWKVSQVAYPREQVPSAWAETFTRMLDAAGWPGDAALDSAEYQAVQAWQGLLDRFAALDPVLPPLAFGQAVERLRELAETTEFQPEDLGARIQITGALEAAGAVYDHLWIAGLDNESWPQPPRPHPFLPPSLQIQYGLPHCSPEREFEFAKRTTERLLGAAPDIVVSSARRAGDRALRASTLIQHLPLRDIGSAEDEYSKFLRRRAALEELDDHTAPAYAATHAPGGAGILESQAKCPFRAFATFRLAARPLEAGALGVDPAGHGSALHRALELFWTRVRSQRELAAMPVEDLRRAIRECAGRAVALLRGAPAGRLDRKFRELEVDRVEWVLAGWIDVERARPPFEVVHCEQRQSIHAGGLDLSTRIDRADRLPDGRLIILDYKTTAPSLKNWEGDRLDEPQLPLYATAVQEPLAAVAFAQLTPGNLEFKGLSEGDVLPGTQPLKPGETLASKVDEWRGVLGTLAEAFRQGHAAVDPKKDACRYCGLDALCRIHERSRAEAGDA